MKYRFSVFGFLIGLDLCEKKLSGQRDLEPFTSKRWEGEN